jgi:hypothetical protein
VDAIISSIVNPLKQLVLMGRCSAFSRTNPRVVSQMLRDEGVVRREVTAEGFRYYAGPKEDFNGQVRLLSGGARRDGSARLRGR